MAMSTFQKVTLATCLVLCVALLLPKMLLSRGKKDADRPDGPGRFPPMANRQKAPDSQRAVGSRSSRAHNTEAIARAKGAGTGAGAGGGKSNLAGQIIPIYGFGILVYILYILFKITSRGNTKPTENKLPSIRAENKKRKITDFELLQLQEKLRETELVMENIVSKANHSPERVKGVTTDQEESLLMQLREITRVMQEGRLMEGMAPENKPQPHWEDFPDEPHQHWEHSHCPHHHDQHNHPQTQTETDAERTEGDGADGADSRQSHTEDPDSEEVEESEDLQKGDSREAVLTAAGEETSTGEEEDTGPECFPGCRNKETPYEPEEEVGQEFGVEEGDIDLGVPKEDLAGVLKELELTLRMTSVMEQEKMEDLSSSELQQMPDGDATTPCAQVRRRNRRRNKKRDAH